MRDVRQFLAYELKSMTVICSMYNVQVFTSTEATGRRGDNALLVQPVRRGMCAGQNPHECSFAICLRCILRIRAAVARISAC